MLKYNDTVVVNSVRQHAKDAVGGTCFQHGFHPNSQCDKRQFVSTRTSATAPQSNAIIMTECPLLPYRHSNILYVLYRWVNYLQYHTICDTNLRDTRCVLFPFTTAAPTSDKYLPSYTQDKLRNTNQSSKFTDTDTK